MTNDTLLLRQVHPSFIQADAVSTQVFSVTSQVFKPTPKDENKLSVYNGEKFTPEESYEHFINQNENNKSFGVLAVTVIECEDLPCIEDNDPFDGHTSIDFSGLGTNQIERKAKKLRNLAMKRDWLFKQL